MFTARLRIRLLHSLLLYKSRAETYQTRFVMKAFVRVLVLSLAATGAFASSHLDRAAGPALHAKVSAMPVPICPPGDPNGCNWCQWHGCESSPQ